MPETMKDKESFVSSISFVLLRMTASAIARTIGSHWEVMSRSRFSMIITIYTTVDQILCCKVYYRILPVPWPRWQATKGLGAKGDPGQNLGGGG